MARSIDRLIRLARKTGDRLIIHDPSDERDIVIMDLDQYEMLVDAKSDLEEYIEDFQTYRETTHSERKAPSAYEPMPSQAQVSMPVMTYVDSHDEQEQEVPFPQEEQFDAPKDRETMPHDESANGHDMVSNVTGSDVREEDSELPPPITPTRVANWIPASVLLEEKFRALTKQAEPPTSVIPDQEPRRVPMKEMKDVEEEFDEDDDEPIFLEEPV